MSDVGCMCGSDAMAAGEACNYDTTDGEPRILRLECLDKTLTNNECFCTEDRDTHNVDFCEEGEFCVLAAAAADDDDDGHELLVVGVA